MARRGERFPRHVGYVCFISLAYRGQTKPFADGHSQMANQDSFTEGEFDQANIVGVLVGTVGYCLCYCCWKEVVSIAIQDRIRIRSINRSCLSP